MVSGKIKIGIIGGSGLEDPSSNILDCRQEVPRSQNDFGLPSSNLFEGKIHGVPVVLLSRHGEGHKLVPSQINYRANIEALRLANCTHVLVSTACGSLTESLPRGQLVIPDSYIDRTIQRKNTFFDGSSKYYPGAVYVPMEPAFNKRMSRIMDKAATELDIPIVMGANVVTIEGPRFSSKAESKMFAQWGGHLVNMTTCPEVSLAKEAGLLYAAIAVVTDYDCWKEQDNVSPREVIKTFKQSIDTLRKLIVKSIQMISQEDWDDEVTALKDLLTSCDVSPS